mmetsp:Transcript_119706/g.267177  ORF Transcript_119706/g.267177 Transcript_119706/m.267177 type:complete len:282 (+) Transcript_119706:97-942(+)
MCLTFKMCDCIVQVYLMGVLAVVSSMFAIYAFYSSWDTRRWIRGWRLLARSRVHFNTTVVARGIAYHGDCRSRRAAEHSFDFSDCHAEEAENNACHVAFAAVNISAVPPLSAAPPVEPDIEGRRARRLHGRCDDEYLVWLRLEFQERQSGQVQQRCAYRFGRDEQSKWSSWESCLFPPSRGARELFDEHPQGSVVKAWHLEGDHQRCLLGFGDPNELVVNSHILSLLCVAVGVVLVVVAGCAWRKVFKKAQGYELSRERVFSRDRLSRPLSSDWMYSAVVA